MEAKEHAFSFIAGHNFYDIPFFQRNYVWDESNWEDLLYSLCEARTGYLGSIILKQEKTPSGETARFMVIDGQQRLTTLSVLLRACYDSIMKLKEELHYPDEVVSQFKSTFQKMCYVIIDSFSGEKRIKIHHSRLDKDSYERVINGKVDEQEDESGIKSGIIGAYNYFMKKLSNYNKSKLQNLWNTLTDGTTKLIVKIDLGLNENEQAIFDAINTSGMRLTCADTVKNVLFQRIIELYDGSEAEKFAFELYEKKWTPVFLNTPEDSLFWSKEIRNGRMKRDNLEILLHSIAVIKGFYEPEGQKISELADCYKDFINKKSLEELIEFISEIHDYASIYKNKMQTNDDMSYRFDDYLSRLLCICEKLEVSTFNPYILHILKSFESNKDEELLKKKCFEIERYIMLHAMCNATTKNYNKECVQLIKGSMTISSLLENDYEIIAEKFYDTLNNMERKDKLSKLILFWCELYERMSRNLDVKELPYKFELEHVLPKKWESNWGVDNLSVYDESGSIITDVEKARSIRNQSVNRIGNLTLLNKKLNIQISNSSYTKKIKGYGVNLLNDFFITRKLIEENQLWDELEENQLWDERSIKTRTDYIIELVLKIWKVTECF